MTSKMSRLITNRNFFICLYSNKCLSELPLKIVIFPLHFNPFTMEYRISKSWRIFAFLLSLFIAGLGIFAICKPSFTGGKEPAVIMIMGGMFILFGIFAFLDVIRTRVIIDKTHINVQRGLTNRTMQLADILG